MRFMAAEAAEIARRLQLFGWGGVKLVLAPFLRFRAGRWLSKRVWTPTPVDPARWPRSELLLAAFGKSLQQTLPPGVEVRPPAGRSFRLHGSHPQFGGFVGMSGRADMPQVLPKDLARDVKHLMGGINKILQRLHPGWPGTSSPAPAFKTKADGEVIRMWWEDQAGITVLRLDDLDLHTAGLA